MSQIRPLPTRPLHFEDALHKTGWGLYYKFLVGFTSVTLFANGFVLLCVHFALPLSSCDTLLTPDDITAIYISFIVGKALGGFLLSSLSDNTGKRCMVSKSFIIIFGSCFISAFSHNVYNLYLAAFFLGSGLQAIVTSIKIYLAEILSVDRRGFYIVLPDLFWTAGYFTTAAFIYYCGTMSTNLSEHQGMDMRLTSWRIIFAVGGGLCITMGCSSALLEMSPRYLLFKHRVITASLVLKQFYAINKSKYSETFDVHSQQLVDLISDYNVNIDPEPVGILQTLLTLAKVMIRMLKIVLRKPFLKLTILVTLIKLPTLLGLSGTTLYLAQLLDTDNSTIHGSHFIHLSLVYIENCTVSFKVNEFQNFLLISLNILFGQIFLLCVIDKFGRKFPIFLGSCTCTVTSLILAYSGNFTLMAISSSLFTLGLTLIESTLYVIVIESFPTAVRGTALGLAHFYSHAVSCFLYAFLNVTREAFLTALALVTFGTSVLVCFVPEMRGRPMVE